MCDIGSLVGQPGGKQRAAVVKFGGADTIDKSGSSGRSKPSSISASGGSRISCVGVEIFPEGRHVIAHF